MASTQVKTLQRRKSKSLAFPPIRNKIMFVGLMLNAAKRKDGNKKQNTPRQQRRKSQGDRMASPSSVETDILPKNVFRFKYSKAVVIALRDYDLGGKEESVSEPSPHADTVSIEHLPELYNETRADKRYHWRLQSHFKDPKLLPPLNKRRAFITSTHR